MPVQFTVLASGSRGNAALVRAGTAGLLLDLGLGPRVMASRLFGVGSRWEKIAAALLTHTHADHVSDATLLGLARRGITLFCHEGHRRELARLAGFEQLDRAGSVRHYDERPFLTPNGLRVEPIRLRHDSGPTFGFRIEGKAERRGRPVSIGYLADTGVWLDSMADALADVDVVGLEFNHDVEMQRRSGRSPALIARNLGDKGHLSNQQGAALLSAVLERSGPGTVRHVVLLHLSQDCNQPALAESEALSAIRRAGRRTKVHAAQQFASFPDLQVLPTRRPKQLGAAALRRPGEGTRPTTLALALRAV